MSSLENADLKGLDNDKNASSKDHNNFVTLNDNEEKKSLLTSSSEEKVNENKTVTKRKVNSDIANQMNNDQRQMGMFLGPIMDELDQLVQKNMRELDKIEEEFNSDSRKQQYDRLISHVPSEIRQRKSIEAIMKNLEDLIMLTKDKSNQEDLLDPIQRKPQEHLLTKLKDTDETDKSLLTQDNSNESEINDLKKSKLSKINNIACLAQSLTAYLVTVNSKKNGERLKNLTIKLYDAVSLWISRLFRFHDSSLLFHDQEPDGLIRMCSMYMNFKYKSYQSEGYKAVKKQPIIYISAASKYSNIEYRELITVQLGLPLSSIKLVKVSKSIDHTLDKIDIPELTKQIEEDINNNFVPLLIVANAGSYSIGQCDDINQLNNLCYTYKMWMHLEGVYLSTLILYSVPTEIQPVFSGDSITLNLSTWIGVPSLSYITLYKNLSKSSIYIQPFNGFLPTFQRCLPYWCVLQALGHDGVLEQIKHAIDMSQNVESILTKHKPYIKLLSFKESRSGNVTFEKTYSISELISKALNFLTYVDINNPIIVFKCDEKHIRDKFFFKESTSPKKPPIKKDFFNMGSDFVPLFESDKKKLGLVSEKKEEKIERDDVDEYTDTLTTWLCNLMNSYHKKIELELIEIDDIGVCIRFSPLDHCNVYNTTSIDLENFSQSLYDMISILDASIKCKSTFEQTIKEYKNLISVNVPKWAGVGAVRYIPEYLLEKLEDIKKYKEQFLIIDSEERLDTDLNDINGQIKLDDISLNSHNTSLNEKSISVEEPDAENNTTILKESMNSTKSVKKHEPPIKNDLIEKYIEEIKSINNSLVEKLQAQDGAFSLGEACDNLVAIKFGMVSEIDDLKNLACQVQDVGKEIEESTRFIEKMSELIRQGIEKANGDLKKENENKLIQQGVLRQLPLVGDIFNWIAPTEPVNTIGRSFNLQSGKVATTEVTYKYRMQIEETKDDSNSLNESFDSNKSSKHNSVLINQEDITKKIRKFSSTSLQSNTSHKAINGDELNKS